MHLRRQSEASGSGTVEGLKGVLSLQASDGLFMFGASQAAAANGQTAGQAGPGAPAGLSPSTSAGNESLVRKPLAFIPALSLAGQG